MYEIFAKLLEEKGITPYRVHKETGVAQSTLSDWKNGKGTPSAVKLKLIADFLGVTVDYLVTGEEPSQKEMPPEKSENITLDDFTYAMYNESKDLSEASKQKLLEMARFFKEHLDNEKR